MKKKLIIIFSILIVFVLFIYFSGIYDFLFFIIREINISRKAPYYESAEVRFDYFYANKSDLEFILDFMNNNKTIESVGRYFICSSRLYEYELKHNYVLCATEKLNKDVIKNIEENIIEKIYNMKLEVIILIKSTDEMPIEYNFRLISNFAYIVQYVYCLDHSECDTKSKFEQYEEGYYIKNKIDDNWYTSYYDIPPL